MSKKEANVIGQITDILTTFAKSQSGAAALEVRGPIQEKSIYRWRLLSSRYKPVTVVLETKKPLFGQMKVKSIGIFGTSQDRKLEPNLEDLRAYLETAELVSAT